MLAYERFCQLGACPTTSQAAFIDKLSSIRVGPLQPIDRETAQALSNELIATVRCNTEDAAKRAITPVLVVAGIAAVGALATIIAVSLR